MTQRQQTTQELLFANLLKEANEQFTPHFFGEQSKQSKLSQANEQLLEAYNYYKNKQINIDTALEYADIKKDIEKRNELLKAANENNKELENLKEQLKNNETSQAILKEELETAKNTNKNVPVPAATTQSTTSIDPNTILPDVATMSTTIIDNTNIKT